MPTWVRPRPTVWECLHPIATDVLARSRAIASR
jgi:hypothetical protein